MRPLRKTRGEEGVTTVEFALVLPIFVLLVSIPAYFGWMYFTQTQITNAANRAARFAAVPYPVSQTVVETDPITGNPQINPITNQPISSTTQVATYAFCQSKIVDRINADLVSQQVTSSEVAVNDGSKPAHTLTDADACSAPSGYVRVVISHSFPNPFAPFVRAFTGQSGDFVLTATGRVRVESQ